jgi:hypothetical protein
VSSHHFVKEGQEPALLILNSTAISFQKVQELLEWSPTVIVAEDQLEVVLGWGIKIDAVICAQPNNLAMNERLKDQLPLKFISYRQFTSGLKIAVEYLTEKRHTALNVLAQSTEEFIEVENTEGIAIEIFLNNQK